MNVNKKGYKKRLRRTPDEAKALIMEVAAERLGRLGLNGLNISGVAKAAGISHATVIHHFGSTGAMREALLQKMTGDLLSDVMEALQYQQSADKVLERLFGTLSRDGHGKLLAWLALDSQLTGFKATTSTGDLFRNIIDVIVSEGGNGRDAKYQVYLVAVAALGLGICGDVLAKLVGLSEKEHGQFPSWLAGHLRTLPNQKS